MLETVLSVVSLLIAYLLGTVPSGYIVARARGVDIQQVGSGNIGATNVLRSVGVLPAIIVVILDPLKGLLAVLLPQWLGLGDWVAAGAGLACIVGNNYNIFLRFRGGKGIATSLGVMIGLDPVVAGISAAFALYSMALGRLVSLGSILGVSLAPVLLLIRNAPLPYTLLALAVMLISLWRHRENIVRLARGTENRLGQRAKVQEPEVPQ